MITPNNPPYSLTGKKIWVAGHNGLVGSAVVRRLQQENCQILTSTRQQADLCRQDQVESWINEHKPDAIIVAAATVGGIHANNSRPAEFIYDNLAIETNIINAAYKAGVEKLLFLGSSCIYPREAAQPMTEEALLTGPLEPTNEWYAIAKIAGIKLCQAYRKQYGCDFISAMPTNLYGIGDNFDLMQSHVLPALMVKTHKAKVEGQASIEVWGTGKPMREFLYVDDLADGLVFMLKNYSDTLHLNIGTGTDVTIRELAETIADVIGFKGDFHFDASKPDGTPRKLLNVDRLRALGWQAETSLRDGIQETYDWYLNNMA